MGSNTRRQTLALEPAAPLKSATRVVSEKPCPQNEKASRPLFEAPQRISVQRAATVGQMPPLKDAVKNSLVKLSSSDAVGVLSSNEQDDNPVSFSVEIIRNISKDTHWTER